MEMKRCFNRAIRVLSNSPPGGANGQQSQMACTPMKCQNILHYSLKTPITKHFLSVI